MKSIEQVLDGFDIEYYKRQAEGTKRFLANYFGDINKTLIVHNAERVPKGVRIVYVSNHRSHLDYLIIPLLLHMNGHEPPAVLAGSNLMRIPLLGRWFERVKGIPVERHRARDRNYIHNFAESIRTAVQRTDILLFIEGGRSYTGSIKGPKTATLDAVVNAQKEMEMQIHVQPVAISYNIVVDQRGFDRLEAAKQWKDKGGRFQQAVGGAGYYFWDGLSFFLEAYKPHGEVHISFAEPFQIERNEENGQAKRKIAAEATKRIKNVYLNTEVVCAAFTIRQSAYAQAMECYDAGVKLLEQHDIISVGHAEPPIITIRNEKAFNYYANSYVHVNRERTDLFGRKINLRETVLKALRT